MSVPFSVVILASRPRSLARCLDSLAAALPAGSECLLVLNGEETACAAVVEGFRGRVSGLEVIEGAPRTLGGARNAAVARAAGDWLCFLDDDVTVPPVYFAVLADKIREYPEASVIGGPNLTPPRSGVFERCSGRLLGSPLCAGPMARRNAGFAQDTWTGDNGLILCNLAVRREHLGGEPPFDPGLVRNEENLLLERLAREGRRALHAPELFVHHERRAAPSGLLRQCFLSGRGRAQMAARLSGTLRPLHLSALLPLAGLAGLALLPAVFIPLGAAYAVLATFNALWLSSRRWESWAGLGWLLVLYPAVQVAYAFGLIWGIWQNCRSSSMASRSDSAPSTRRSSPSSGAISPGSPRTTAANRP